MKAENEAMVLEADGDEHTDEHAIELPGSPTVVDLPRPTEPLAAEPTVRVGPAVLSSLRRVAAQGLPQAPTNAEVATRSEGSWSERGSAGSGPSGTSVGSVLSEGTSEEVGAEAPPRVGRVRYGTGRAASPYATTLPSIPLPPSAAPRPRANSLSAPPKPHEGVGVFVAPTDLLPARSTTFAMWRMRFLAWATADSDLGAPRWVLLALASILTLFVAGIILVA